MIWSIEIDAEDNIWLGIFKVGSAKFDESSFIINKIPLNNSYSISPNPAKNIIYINHSSPALVNIFNITGQQVKEAKLTTEKNINISSLNVGIYILQEIERAKIYNTKIIKQ